MPRRKLHSQFFTDADVFNLLEPEERRFSRTKLLLQGLRRGVLLSSEESRAELIERLAVWPNVLDSVDQLLGVLDSPDRRPAIQAVGLRSLVGIPPESDLMSVLEMIQRDKVANRSEEDIRLLKDGKRIVINVDYSEHDRRQSSLRQWIQHEARVEVTREDDALMIRAPQNRKGHELVKRIRAALSSAVGAEVEEARISLLNRPNRAVRTAFFMSLMTSLPGFTPFDVVRVSIARDDDVPPTDDKGAEEIDEQALSVVRHAVLSGRGVTGTAEFDGLRDHFYIHSAVWKSICTKSQKLFEFEAGFLDRDNCEGFGYKVRGYYRKRAGTLEEFQKTRKPCEPSDERRVGHALEQYARQTANSSPLPSKAGQGNPEGPQPTSKQP